MALAQHYFMIVFEVIDKATKALQVIDKNLDTVQNDLKELNTNFKGFDMGAMSIMFFGQAIMRTFGGIFRSLLNTSELAKKNTTAFGQATSRLTASWEFLKFTIINALSNPAFIEMIDNLITTVEKVAEWVQNNDELVVGIGKVSALLFALGAGMATSGQIYLGVKALSEKFGTMFDDLDTWLKDATNDFIGLKEAIGIITVGITIAKAVTDDETTVGDMIETFISLAIIGTTLGWSVAGGIGAVVLAIRFAKDPLGLGESLGTIVGTITAVFVELAHVLGSILAQITLAPMKLALRSMLGDTQRALEKFGFDDLARKVKGIREDLGVDKIIKVPDFSDKFKQFGTGFEFSYYESMSGTRAGGMINATENLNRLKQEETNKIIENIEAQERMIESFETVGDVLERFGDFYSNPYKLEKATEEYSFAPAGG